MARFKEVKFGSDKHRKIVQSIRERKDFSLREMQRRHEAWKKSEERFLAYIPKKEEDKVKEKRREQGEVNHINIEIPYSYAILMSMHTYWTSVFLGRSPIFQFTGRHGEPMQAVQAVESLVDYQVQVGEMTAPLYVWLLDVGKYGLGVISDFWTEEFSKVTNIEEKQPTFAGVPIPGAEPKKTKVSRKMRSYQGNKVFNVRPYDWLPDPRVPITKFQTGEFCGRKLKLSMHDIEAGKEDGKYFNVEELKKRVATSSVHPGQLGDEADPGSEQIDMPTEYTPDFSDKGKKGQVSVVEMTVKIIPKDWGLGDGSYPEKWVFTVAEDQVLIGLEPLGAYHDQFPFDILTLEMDGYSISPRSAMEILQPLQDTLNWLVNSHFHNVRQVLNNQFILDPSRVTMKDATDPEPGKLIRAKPAGYGEDVRTMMSQLPVQDVTQNHLQDASLITEIMQLVAGVNNTIMGVSEEGGRKTATEVRTTSTASVNRMTTVAEWFSALGFAPLATKLVSNSQQFYDEEMKLKVAGGLWGVKGAEEFIDVSPESIMGFYDFVPVDGTMPVDRFAQVNLWKELMQMMGDLGLSERFDMAAIFSYVAQLAGVKNVDQFKVNVVGDEELMRRARNGDSVPAETSLGEILQNARTGTGGRGAQSGQSGQSGTRASDQRPAQEASARSPNTGEVGGVGPPG